MSKNYYKILGVEKDASEEEITKAYRKLAKKYHPDTSTEPDCVQKFKEIGEAYDRLINPQLNTPNAPRQSAHAYDIFNNRFNSWDTYSEDRIITITKQVTISIKEHIYGTELTLDIPEYDTCKTCNGSGFSSYEDCPECKATGYQTISANGGWTFKVACNKCGGSCKTNLKRCNCNSGFTEKDKVNFTFKIPPGLPLHHLLKFTFSKNVVLLCKVNVEEHKNISIIDNNILYNVYLPGSLAYHGGKFDLTFFDKTFSLSVPALTQSGTRFRLKGQGISGGDMYVITEIDVNSLNVEKPQENLVLDFSNK